MPYQNPQPLSGSELFYALAGLLSVVLPTLLKLAGMAFSKRDAIGKIMTIATENVEKQKTNGNGNGNGNYLAIISRQDDFSASIEGIRMDVRDIRQKVDNIEQRIINIVEEKTDRFFEVARARDDAMLSNDYRFKRDMQQRFEDMDKRLSKIEQDKAA